MQIITELTAVTEIPIIRTSSGELLDLGGDFLSLSPDTQREVARGMGGKLVWIKVRAVYTPIDKMCTIKGCFNYRCSTHPGK